MRTENLLKEINFLAHSKGVNAFIRGKLQELHREVRLLARPKSEPVTDERFAANYRAWAIGTPQRNGFNVRRIVWGKLMARLERRKGEEIRKAQIKVGSKHSR